MRIFVFNSFFGRSTKKRARLAGRALSSVKKSVYVLRFIDGVIPFLLPDKLRHKDASA